MGNGYSGGEWSTERDYWNVGGHLFLSFFWLIMSKISQVYLLNEPALKFVDSLYCSVSLFVFISLISSLTFLFLAIYWVWICSFLFFQCFEFHH